MTQRVFTDRSRIETHQRCPRLRWLEYHSGEARMGVVSARKPLPLAVGGSVHAGLAVLLQCTMGIPLGELSFELAELKAVRAALADFSTFANALDIDTSEQAAFLATTTDPSLKEMHEGIVRRAKSDFDLYLYTEQAALVEGMVRAYARRRLRPLLEQYEVLEVEREGQWELHESEQDFSYPGGRRPAVWFMSRPDALLLERDSRQLYILSFKTAGGWDIRKARDAEHDMQGLGEGVEVEKRLARHWEVIQQVKKRLPEGQDVLEVAVGKEVLSGAMLDFLKRSPAPPRILGIRYEYMLKGDRWVDKDLSAKLGVEVRSQRSPLVRGYLNQGMTSGDEQWNVSWDYVKEDGTSSKLYWKNWKSSPVWEHQTMREWIDKLDATVMTVGEENHELGFSCPAQSTGFLATHPLDDIFIPPIVVYRNDDDLRDWVEQIEAQERRVAEGVQAVRAAGSADEERSMLNVHFPMTRRACEYPTTCSMSRLCYGGEDIRRDPLGSGLYSIRKANHPQEVASDKS
jgi:hypothetical protein